MMKMKPRTTTDEVPEPLFKDKQSPIRIFLPFEALRGEQIPCYALWPSSESFDRIEISLPKELEVVETFNTEEKDWSRTDKGLTVRKVEQNGYLGMLLDSSSQSELVKANVGLRFVSSRGTRTFSRPIHLFRPTIQVLSHGREEPVNIVDQPIVIRKDGPGTALVNIATEDDSQVVLREPVEIAEFAKQFRQDVKTGIAELKRRYQDNESIFRVLEKVERFIVEPPDLSHPDDV